MNIKLKNLLGIGIKARKIISGEDSCKAEVKKNKVYLVIVAEDASENTKKVFKDKTEYRKIPLRFIGSKEEIGKSIGKNNRAVIAVKDPKFAQILLSLIDEENT